MFSRPSNRKWDASSILVNGAIAFVGFWCIAVLLCAAVYCIPLQEVWNPTLPGHCIDVGAFYYGVQIPSIVTDILLLICPLYEIHRAGLKNRQHLLAAVSIIAFMGAL